MKIASYRRNFSIFSVSNSMKRVIKLIDGEYIIVIDIVVHKHVHECAVRVVCDVM